MEQPILNSMPDDEKIQKQEPVQEQTEEQEQVQDPGYWDFCEKAWNEYREALEIADQAALQQVQRIDFRSHVGWWIRVVAFCLIILAVNITLFWGLYQIFSKLGATEPWIGWLTLASFLSLIFLLYRNPVKENYHSALETARAQLIMQGYIRQLQQTDIVFKRYLFWDALDQEALLTLSQHTQTSMEHMDNLFHPTDEPNL
jgi:hypothetical protein